MSDLGKPNDAVTLDEFRSACVEFIKEAPTLDARTLEAAWSAVAKMYLGVWPADKLNITLAVGALELAASAKLKRENVIRYGEDPLDKLKKLVGMN